MKRTGAVRAIVAKLIAHRVAHHWRVTDFFRACSTVPHDIGPLAGLCNPGFSQVLITPLPARYRYTGVKVRTRYSGKETNIHSARHWSKFRPNNIAEISGAAPEKTCTQRFAVGIKYPIHT